MIIGFLILPVLIISTCSSASISSINQEQIISELDPHYYSSTDDLYVDSLEKVQVQTDSISSTKMSQ